MERGKVLRRCAGAICSFTQRVSSAWMVLPVVVVEADTLVPFERLLDGDIDMHGMVGYELCAGRSGMVLAS